MKEANIKNTLNQQIAEKSKELNALNIDQKTAAKIYNNSPDVLKDVKKWIEYSKENEAALLAHQLIGDIDRLKASLDLELVEISTRYLLTDSKLTSPSGFHPSDNVWVKSGSVWIETNRMPRQTNLNCYDIHKTISG